MLPGNTLTTSTNSGSQSTASDNSLQSSVAANGISGGTPSSIQPGTNTNALLSTGGIPLTQGSLSTVSLGATTQTTTATPVTHHHANPVALGLSAALFIFAIGLFWFMGRVDKNTTIN